MKKRFVSVFTLLIGAAVLVGCGGDPPNAELADAKRALDDARAAGAEKFAASQYAAAQSAYNQAESSLKEEADKLFKNFDEKVKPMIADAKSKAEQAKSAALAAKNKAKQAAEGVIADAAAAIQKARAVLDEAPYGKGNEGDVDQLRNDLKAADADLSAARSAVGSENFDGARTRANSAKSAADKVASGTQVAIDKYNEMKEKMTPWYLKN